MGWELTAVFRGLGEAACPGAVVGPCYVVAVDDQRAAEEVLALVESAVWGAGVHVCQATLHVVGREHVDVLDAEGLEDVLLEVVVQGHARDALDDGAGPVDVHLVSSLGISTLTNRTRRAGSSMMAYAVFPFASGLEGEWLPQHVSRVSTELVNACRKTPSTEFVVEEGVAGQTLGLRLDHSFGHGAPRKGTYPKPASKHVSH